MVDQEWESPLTMTGGGSRVPMGWESPLKCQYTNLIWEREEGISCPVLFFAGFLNYSYYPHSIDHAYEEVIGYAC